MAGTIDALSRRVHSRWLNLALLLVFAGCSRVVVTSVPDGGSDGGSSADVPLALDGAFHEDSALGCLSDLGTDPWGVTTVGASASDTTPLSVRPNATLELAVRRLDCCYSFFDHATCATWRVTGDPEATIVDGGAGRATLHVGDVAPGTILTVTAQVGDRALRTPIAVTTIPDPALIGTYTEVARIGCDGAPLADFTAIREMRISADGSIQVTWVPFERYVDYWATYAADPDSHTLSFSITGGNYVPSDVDAEGVYSFDDAGELHLEDLYLGTAEDHHPAADRGCEHVFSR